MDFLRNKEVKLQILICFTITVVCCFIGLLFYKECCWLLLMTGSLISFVALLFTYWRYEKISSISQDIDRVLHGEEKIRFNEYTEGELAVLQNELSKMTLRLWEQTEQLRKDKTYLADSLADISHQLKTPLTALEIANSALLQENIDKEQQYILLQEQMKLLSHMEWLIAVLLKLSRLDAGTIEFEEKPFSLKTLVRQAVAPFEITMDLKNIILDISKIPDIQLCGDIKWLAEALSNIIKNCIESTPNGGQVTIVTEDNAMYTKISIMDNGSGIPKEDLPYLFDRFYRSKNSNKNGVGIGLSLARAIINRQNGSITVENRIPHGANFSICFYKGIA